MCVLIITLCSNFDWLLIVKCCSHLPVYASGYIKSVPYSEITLVPSLYKCKSIDMVKIFNVNTICDLWWIYNNAYLIRLDSCFELFTRNKLQYPVLYGLLDMQ